MNKIITTFLLLAGLCASAQVKIGDNPTSINASAVLEMESTNKGLLPPRLTTAQRDAITNPSVGLMIYNTETKCTETFLGIGITGTSNTGWKNLCKANINATFTASTLNCAVANSLAGDYVATVAMTASNYKTVTVTTLSAGDYTVSTDEQNGVKFSTEGTISSIGAGTQLKLMATGTPYSAGSFTYTVTLSGQTCTFSVTYANPPATLQNGSVTCSGGTLSGNYAEGSITVASVHTRTVTVTPTSIGYCTLSTTTMNGITFSGSATFTAGQVGSLQTITLNASGTPTASGTFTYDITGSNVTAGCTFDVSFTASKAVLFGTVGTNTGGDFTLTSSYNNKLSAVNGTQITLLPGKTYYLQADIMGNFGVTGFANFAWVDASNNRLPLASYGSIQSLNRVVNDASTATAVAYIKPTVATVVKLRVYQQDQQLSPTDPSYSKFFIKEVSANSLYFMGIPPGTQTLTAANQAVNLSMVTNNTVSGNSITCSGSTITLKGGKTYKLTANLLPTFAPNASATDSYATFRWFDGSGTGLGSSSVLFSQSNNTTENMQNAAVAVVSPAADIQVSLKMVTLASNNTLSFVYPQFSSVIVEEIDSGALYYFGNINSQSIAAGNTDLTLTQVSNNTNNGQSLSSSGATITLKAGRNYYVSARIFGSIPTGQPYFVYQLVNSSNNQVAISKRGAALGMNYNTRESNQPEVSGIIQATTDIQVKLRSVFQGGTYGSASTYSPVLITEF